MATYPHNGNIFKMVLEALRLLAGVLLRHPGFKCKTCKDLKWQRSMSRGQLNLYFKAACQRTKKASYPFCKYVSNWSAFSIKSAAMADNLINRARAIGLPLMHSKPRQEHDDIFHRQANDDNPGA